MATANDFAVANSYLPPKKPVLGQNELAVWVGTYYYYYYYLR